MQVAGVVHLWGSTIRAAGPRGRRWRRRGWRRQTVPGRSRRIPTRIRPGNGSGGRAAWVSAAMPVLSLLSPGLAGAAPHPRARTPSAHEPGVGISTSDASRLSPQGCGVQFRVWVAPCAFPPANEMPEGTKPILLYSWGWTLRRVYGLRVGQVFDQAGEEADQVRIGLDSDPLVHPMDPLQVVRRDAQGQESVDVRGNRGVMPRVRRDHRQSGGEDGTPVDLGDRLLECAEPVGVGRRDPRRFGGGFL